MRSRHGREAFLIAGEGVRRIGNDGEAEVVQASALQATVQFRFSRFTGVKSATPNSTNVLMKLAVAMSEPGGSVDPTVPAGYTYLGQFIDHDLTLDESELDLGKAILVEDLVSKRSPSLDLDSLYGDGPVKSPQYYEPDGVHLKRGRPLATGGSGAAAQDGMDLPRHRGGAGPRRGTEREANIPDIRNDENLAVAQIHVAFIRFHNRVVDTLIAQNTPSSVLFDRARELVTKHYQWLIVNDYLPRIAEPSIVSEVFLNGRKHFEVNGQADATMPVEFSGAAFRLGHSQIRVGYQWNKIFNRERGAEDPLFSGHLFRLFRFSGTSGNMSPSSAIPASPQDLADLEHPQNPGVELPDVWVADYTRLFDFSGFDGIPPTPPADFNNAMAIDAHVVEPLKILPIGSFGGVGEPDLVMKRSLAFRNLARGRMLALPSGQQLADALQIGSVLTAEQILDGNGGPKLSVDLISGDQRTEAGSNTPLWFYILREAEWNQQHKNKLGPVGATVVAETFHRAIEKSHHSILADRSWKPSFGAGDRFNMADLLFFAFEGKPELLNPHG